MLDDPRSETRTGERTATGSHALVAAGAGRAAASIQGGDWRSATDRLLATLDHEATPDLAIVFVDSRFSRFYGDIVARLQEEIRPGCLVGCSGQGVIGPGLEAEAQPAISVMTLALPNIEITPLVVLPGPEGMPDLAPLANFRAAGWLLFADPFSVDVDALVTAAEERAPGLTLVGGMASAHDGAGSTAVFLDGEVYDSGAVFVGLTGDLEVHTLVAQGAEPIGQPWTITACEGNLVQTIGNRPAVEVLIETLEALDPATRERAQRNLLVGLAMDEYRTEHVRGDYLVRNIMGAEQESGVIAINAIPRLGQTFQFQFRDATAADDDLRRRLEGFREALTPDRRVLGALLCTCNGRGTGLFGTPNHDAEALTSALGALPTAGFFCNGEIGPVGGRTFLHGFTASLGLLVTREE